MHNWDERLELDFFEMASKRHRYLKDKHPGLRTDSLSYFSNIFNCFPYFSNEARKQAVAEAAELWETVRPFCTLKTKVKYFAIQTVPGLYAWNKRRNNRRSRENSWPANSTIGAHEMETRWLEAEVWREDPLKLVQNNGSSI